MTNDRFVKRVTRPVAAVLLLSGCFHYVPAEVTPLPSPRTEVRITLSQPLDIPMGEFTLHDVTRIEGIVADADGDTLGMVARWLYPRVGQKYDAMLGSYGIPVTQIQQLEKWRVSGRNTVILLGVITASVVLLGDLVSRALGGAGLLPIGGDNQSVVAPR